LRLDTLMLSPPVYSARQKVIAQEKFDISGIVGLIFFAKFTVLIEDDSDHIEIFGCIQKLQLLELKCTFSKITNNKTAILTLK